LNDGGRPSRFQYARKEAMFDFIALCPHCEEKFKLSMIGLEAKEFIQCPHCRRIIKLDANDPERKALKASFDFAD